MSDLSKRIVSGETDNKDFAKLFDMVIYGFNVGDVYLALLNDGAVMRVELVSGGVFYHRPKDFRTVYGYHVGTSYNVEEFEAVCITYNKVDVPDIDIVEGSPASIIQEIFVDIIENVTGQPITQEYLDEVNYTIAYLSECCL